MRLGGDGWVYYDPATIEHLKRLAEAFDFVWATAWEHSANESLSEHFELPTLEVIEFGTTRGEDGRIYLPPAVGRPYGVGSWKLPWIANWGAENSRPLAWIDDDAREDAVAWAKQREHPTLIVKTDPSVGITQDEVERLLKFAMELEWENDGVELNRCECGTAEIEVIPDQDHGFRCAGCQRVIWDGAT